MRPLWNATGLLPAFVLLTITAAGPAGGADLEPLEGRVFFNERPFSGTVVSAYIESPETFLGNLAGRSEATGADGIFRLRLPAGSYYLVATKGKPGSDETYFGFRRRPLSTGIVVSDGYYLQVVPRSTPKLEETTGGGAIRGHVLGPDGPVAGAMVFLYKDPQSGFRGPADFALQGPEGTDGEGRFSMEIPDGDYYLIGLWRQGGRLRGPPRPGDLWGYFDGNPVTVRSGVTISLDLHMAPKLDPVKSAPVGIRSGTTGIRGAVKSGSGEVPAGLFVYAVDKPDALLGGLPPYRTIVDDRGAFSLELPEGTFYLVVRAALGGPPLKGEWFGIYGGETPAPVTVGKEIVEGIEIPLDQVK